MGFHYNPLNISVESSADFKTLLLNPVEPTLQRSQDGRYFWLKVPISPHQIIKFLTVIMVSLVGLNIVTQTYRVLVLNMNESKGIIRLFDLDSENNFPSVFSFGLLAIVCGLLGLIAIYKHRDGDRYRRHWTILSGIFGFLALDELMSFHELMINPLKNLFNTSGVFYFAWVIPALVVVVGIGIGFLQFVLALPHRTRRLFLIAAAVYVGGALGMEMVGGIYSSIYNQRSLIYAGLTTLEETLEMTGMIIFIQTLLTYIRRELLE